MDINLDEVTRALGPPHRSGKGERHKFRDLATPTKARRLFELKHATSKLQTSRLALGADTLRLDTSRQLASRLKDGAALDNF